MKKKIIGITSAVAASAAMMMGASAGTANAVSLDTYYPTKEQCYTAGVAGDSLGHFSTWTCNYVSSAGAWLLWSGA